MAKPKRKDDDEWARIPPLVRRFGAICFLLEVGVRECLAMDADRLEELRDTAAFTREELLECIEWLRKDREDFDRETRALDQSDLH